jgi:protease I
MRVDKARFPIRKPEIRAVILTADKFEDLELFVPYFRLLEEGIGVDVAAPRIEKITGENGYVFENVDLTIDQVDPARYDLLIIPGGLPTGAPSTVRKMAHAIEIATSFFATGKPVAAICHGPYTLVSANVVRGRKLTSYWGDGVPEEIKQAGGQWIDAEVVVDGNLVSSRWPADLPAFCREMMVAVERIRTSRR